ncbi:hypothetical protein K439DRAFT_1619770 [Ramaria rubella]|nr:hypothetical protein K439DRAFT_1619770 [Ramaria rubella]
MSPELTSKFSARCEPGDAHAFAPTKVRHYVSGVTGGVMAYWDGRAGEDLRERGRCQQDGIMQNQLENDLRILHRACNQKPKVILWASMHSEAGSHTSGGCKTERQETYNGERVGRDAGWVVRSTVHVRLESVRLVEPDREPGCAELEWDPCVSCKKNTLEPDEGLTFEADEGSVLILRYLDSTVVEVPFLGVYLRNRGAIPAIYLVITSGGLV